MKQIRKRSWAMALALAMIVSLFTGISARAESENTGFVIAGIKWKENDPNPYFADSDWFGKEYTVSIYDENYISLGNAAPPDVLRVTDISKIYILDDHNNDVTNDKAFIFAGEMRWDEGQNQDVFVNYDPGVYRLCINTLGTYNIVNVDYPDQFIKVEVVLPDFAVCSTDQMTPETILANAWQDFTYEPGGTYYLVANPDIAQMDWIKGIRLNLHDVIGGSTINWSENGYEPIEFTIPESFTDYLGDDFIEAFVIYKNGENPNDVREDRKCIRANCSQNGLIISDSDWHYDDVIQADRNFPRDINEEDRFSKGFGVGIYYNSKLTLVLNKNGVRSYLKDTDLDKLSILDEEGTVITDTDVAQITMDRYGYNVQDSNNNWVWTEADSEDVFNLVIRKSGRYIIKYTDGDYSSSAVIDADVPDMAIYGKNKISESYILGGDEVQYNNDRNTFYILFRDINDEFFTEDLTIKSIRSMDGDVNDITVKTDKENGIITVNISDEAKENADEFGICVIYKREKTWYRYDEENDEKIVERSEINDNDERWFRFKPSDEIRGYSEEAQADIDAADAVEKLIDALPDKGNITADDEAAIKAAKEAYDALTDEQKSIISDSKVNALEEAETALEAAKEAKKEADKKEAERLQKIAEEKAAAVEAAKKEAEDAAKAAEEAAVKAATEKANKEAAEKLAAELKKAADEKAAALEAAKKEAEEAAEKARKAALPKVGDEILDKTSKAAYKILTVADGTKEGTVEYVGATKKIKSAKIPESITVNDATYKVVSIGASAFEGDTLITSVTIPSSVMRIGSKAFNGCSKLKTINIYGEKLASIGGKAFKGIKKGAKFTIYVSDKSKSDKIKKSIKKSKPKKAKYKFVKKASK